MHLAPDDIVSGMSVIVESTKSDFEPGFSNPTSKDFYAYQDMQWLSANGGRPAEVVSVNYPFAAIRIFGQSQGSRMFSYRETPKACGELHSVDLRRFNLIRCDRDMLKAFVCENLPRQVFDLPSIFGAKAAKAMASHGIRSIEQVVMHYRHDYLRKVPGIGDAAMRKVENVMAIMGVAKNDL